MTFPTRSKILFLLSTLCLVVKVVIAVDKKKHSSQQSLRRHEHHIAAHEITTQKQFIKYWCSDFDSTTGTCPGAGGAMKTTNIPLAYEGNILKPGPGGMDDVYDQVQVGAVLPPVGTPITEAKNPTKVQFTQKVPLVFHDCVGNGPLPNYDQLATGLGVTEKTCITATGTGAGIQHLPWSECGCTHMMVTGSANTNFLTSQLSGCTVKIYVNPTDGRAYAYHCNSNPSNVCTFNGNRAAAEAWKDARLGEIPVPGGFTQQTPLVTNIPGRVARGTAAQATDYDVLGWVWGYKDMTTWHFFINSYTPGAGFKTTALPLA